MNNIYLKEHYCSNEFANKLMELLEFQNEMNSYLATVTRNVSCK